MVLAGGSVLGLNDGFGYKDFDFFIIEENAQEEVIYLMDQKLSVN